MYDYFQGKIVEKNPAYVVLDCHGIGYMLNISINTFDKIPNGGECKLFVHQAIREDAHVLYGFAEPEERVMFRDLISVSGVGAATARVMLSSMSPNDIQNAIVNGDVSRLKAIKGIGEKTAQRIIVDLKSKVGKENFGSMPIIGGGHNNLRSEALNALETLGFVRNAAEKAVDKIIREGGNSISLEELVKSVLKNF
ncbi:MAG TPA: Holliday junction branch migration protein RuvA [Bacteroidia bacterium]|jgi:Holliday junction DNA helicase RuvA|nr:Holliday junction branch migration protein RuvA [Bacteroidia bacterium]